MYYFKPDTISFADNYPCSSLLMDKVYNLNILVNGRPILWSSFKVQREQRGNQSTFTFINDKEDEKTTLYFHYSIYTSGPVDTVDIIIRDANGIAIEAFLNVDFIGGKRVHR